MRVWKHIGILIVCLAATSLAGGGQIVDRIVANVNGHVLLQSDWEEELAVEGLLNVRTPDTFTSAERKAALERLIDQELLREQVRPSEIVAPEQIAARLAEVRTLYANATTEEGWRAVLQRYGLTESTVQRRLGEDLQLMRLVEARLRPSIQIDQKAVESYYQEQLLPEIRKSGGREIALAEVVGHIRDLLAEQKLNQLLSNWLASLRSEGHIETPEPDSGDQSR
jgi:peptidyl-prolyl cis-trans isomerase SurA